MIFVILSFVIIIAGTILIGLDEYSGKEIKNDIPKLDYLGQSRLIKTNFKPHWWYDEHD